MSEDGPVMFSEDELAVMAADPVRFGLIALCGHAVVPDGAVCGPCEARSSEALDTPTTVATMRDRANDAAALISDAILELYGANRPARIYELLSAARELNERHCFTDGAV